MGAVYLTALADWLTADGCDVLEWDGWQHRGRSSGGFEPGRPWCVVWHHTASDTAPANDAAYIAEGDPDAPLANLLIDRQGLVWVIAAGATNTNGKGGPWPVSRGTIPADQANTHAVGVEIANAGTGEPYTAAQLEACFTVSLSLTGRLGLAPTDALEHVEWAPGRKIDPATAQAAAAAGWAPRAINASGSWNGDDLRAELARRAGHAPTPTPGDDDMTITAVMDPDGSGRIWAGTGAERWIVPSMAILSNMIVLGGAGCYRFVNASGDPVREIGDIYQVGPDTLEAIGRA